MNHTCESLSSYLNSFSLIRHCDTVKDGSLRLATPFQYPDGSLIDVFLESDTGDMFTDLVLTDKGQTISYLLDLQIKPWSSKRRKSIVSKICSSLEVRQERGEFLVRFDSTQIASISDHIVRLAQACIRITDLVFTQRLRTPAVFFEDVEEFIAGMDCPYDANFLVDGGFDEAVEVDFRVKGKKVESLIQTVSTPSVTAHSATTEAFRKFYDIRKLNHSYQCVTVYDSERDNFRSDDIKRLSDVSEVVAFPAESDRLKELIAA